ncbi:DUF885 family protein [Gemmatimonas sp.]|uniref:DUF885 family protein n=1 Tax=Gemmatimonas sp. TaxID=1962908 RepID=UPI0037C14078
MIRSSRTALAAAALLAIPLVLSAQPGGVKPTTQQNFPADPAASVPALTALVSTRASEMVDVISRFASDQQVLQRRYDAPDSPAQRSRTRAFYIAWRNRLGELAFDKLSQEGKADYALLENHLRYQLELMDREEVQRKEMLPLLPFADRVLALQDARRDLKTIDAQASARTLADVAKMVDSLRALLEPAPARPAGDSANGTPRAARVPAPKVSRTVGNRAADQLDQIRNTVGVWYRYYNGYDPLFSWWVTNPYQKLDDAMRRYATTIRTRVVGIQPAPVVAAGGGGQGGAAQAPRNAAAANEPIIGDPIGAEGLAVDLRHAMIPYTADELIAIAEKEYAFSLAEAKKAARELGLGDDWKAAMEKVKNMYVEPGKQPDLIRDLANEADAFFAKHDWVTIPALAREDWRMEMMAPERQRVSPFFLGGDLILVSYPTADMTDEEKLMSMRGNNPFFSRATVFHELNPGHHLQGFMTARYNAHRRLFSTPFWNEGQSLYWEMFLWDHDFHVTPEDRLGALAWRMHRSARIVFSLSFHLGKMTPEQAIEYVVDKVPFERANAEGEVRRSFNGSYSPIYQAAYMLGGLQLRALYKELVISKKMTDRQFHDAVLQGGPMPIAMVRARLANVKLSRDGAAPWRFADDLPAPRPFPAPR